MSMYGDPSIADLLPAYYCNIAQAGQMQRQSAWKGFLTHFMAMAIAIGLCLGGFYYYQNIYLPSQSEDIKMKTESASPVVKNNDKIVSFKHSDNIILQSPKAQSKPKDSCFGQIEHVKKDLAAIHDWRTSVNAHLTKMEWDQDVRVNKAVEEALEIHEADGIGQMDYAASYAGGAIVAISKDTRPHPTHRPFSLFKLLNVDVLSSPEEIIRPCVLPGSCFAFRGTSGTIRIRLGKPIPIGSVTLSHASKLLLESEGMSSAPKDFKVLGFTDIEDEDGTFLGTFTYDATGKQHQTFEIKASLSLNEVFEEIELVILNNYGKDDFTCVYRFRVHKLIFDCTNKSTQTPKIRDKKKKCC